MTDYNLVPKSIVDELAQFIRQVDGSHKLGAGALAEKICERFHVDASAVQGVPVFLYRRRGLHDFVTCSYDRYAELSGKPHLFETQVLYTIPQPAEQDGERPTMPDEFYEGLGWMHAECCAAMDRGEDPRTFEVGDMVNRCIHDLTHPQPAEQPDPTDAQILAITTAYEQGVGKGHDAHHWCEEIQNPYGASWGCDKAWQMGYEEGKEQAANGAKRSAVKPRPAPDVAGLDIEELYTLLMILRNSIGGTGLTLDGEVKELAVRTENAISAIVALAAHRKQGGES